jgi:hypothetical protein
MKYPSLFLLPATVFALTTFGLMAADVWTSKPFPEWSDKDVQKLMTDSPWAKTALVTPVQLAPVGGNDLPQATGLSTGGGGGAAGAASPGGGGKGGGGSVGGGSPVGGGGGGGKKGGGRGAVQELTQTYVIRFMSALPMKQGAQKMRLGKEATTSPEAKALIEREEKEYIVVVSIIPPEGGGRGGKRGKSSFDSDSVKAAMKECTLSAKGRDPLTPSDVQLHESNGAMDAFLFFSKKNPFTADDKEIEVAFKFAGSVVKEKFHPKDMVFNGKLEM